MILTCTFCRIIISHVHFDIYATIIYCTNIFISIAYTYVGSIIEKYLSDKKIQIKDYIKNELCDQCVYILFLCSITCSVISSFVLLTLGLQILNDWFLSIAFVNTWQNTEISKYYHFTVSFLLYLQCRYLNFDMLTFLGEVLAFFFFSFEFSIFHYSLVRLLGTCRPNA